MQSNFPAALRHVLNYEGGYVNHPADPGGATNLGITKPTLERYRGASVSIADVKSLRHSEAAAIYRRLYWDAAKCDSLPPGLDLALFDSAVNQGVARACRLLNQALGLGSMPHISGATLEALARKNPEVVLKEFMARRMRAYGALSRLFRTFGLGWSRRLMATHTLALTLINPRASAPTKGSAMTSFLDRLKEPSTYAGMAAFFAGVGLLGLTEPEWNQIFGSIASLAGVAAIFLSDSPSDNG